MARTPVAAVALLVLFGTISFALGPVVQNAVIEAARVPGGSLVSAANQGAFNVANAVGAALGALVISSGLGYTAPMWVGAVLALVGAAIAVLARAVDSRPAPGAGAPPGPGPPAGPELASRGRLSGWPAR